MARKKKRNRQKKIQETQVEEQKHPQKVAKNDPVLKVGAYEVSFWQLVALIVVAYLFSVGIRYIWVDIFSASSSMRWNKEFILTTNDGYFFSTGAQAVLEGIHENNPRIPNMWQFGTVFLTTMLAKYTPFSLDTITMYMPVFVSSLLVIPIILIARLYNKTVLGFFAALLGSIALSYYNRTMVGYYDTDMFSVMAPMFILYFLMKNIIDFNLRSALYAALFIAVYPFLYDQGRSLVYVMGIVYALYLLYYHRGKQLAYYSIILVFLALVPFTIFVPVPYDIPLKVLALLAFFVFFRTVNVKENVLIGLSIVLLIAFLYFGNAIGGAITKMSNYVSTGTLTEGLRFYGVQQTIKESNNISFSTFAKRITGSEVAFILSMVGYVLLTLKHRAFLLALPMLGLGYFALAGGLRFTIYAVPIAALGVMYLLFILGDFFKDKRLKYGFIVLATASIIYPNIKHIQNYRVGTVVKASHIRDLVKLNDISTDKDMTLTWWDYGYPLWYYAGTSTLIDGGKHQNDNFIASKMFLTTSPMLAANLGSVAAEIYIQGVESKKAFIKNGKKLESIPHEFKFMKEGKAYHAGGKPAVDLLFRNKQADQKNPNSILQELKENTYAMPPKTREVFWYLPSRMMKIYPTITRFANLDLNTGKQLRNVEFYYTLVAKRGANNQVILRNNMILDLKKGHILIRGKTKKLKQYIISNYESKSKKTVSKSKFYHFDGRYSVILKNGKIAVMDDKTFNSMYVQMGLLGKYDTSLFELVVSSPESKIYKIKR